MYMSKQTVWDILRNWMICNNIAIYLELTNIYFIWAKFNCFLSKINISFIRKSYSKLSSSKGFNKSKLKDKHEMVEIKSWIDFYSWYKIDDEELICLQSIGKKEESKEYASSVCKIIKNKHINLLHKQTFEKQMLSKIRQFFNRDIPKLNEQNKNLITIDSIKR